MRAAAASVARAVWLRKHVSRRDVARSVWSRKQTSWCEVARASSNPQQASTSHPAGVLPIPIARKHPADGPSYVVDDAGAVIRFLAFHGCGSRFTILYKRGEDSAEFDAAELELEYNPDLTVIVGDLWKADASSNKSGATCVNGLTLMICCCVLPTLLTSAKTSTLTTRGLAKTSENQRATKN